MRLGLVVRLAEALSDRGGGTNEKDNRKIMGIFR